MAVICLLVASCTSVGNAWMTATAKDQIMLVRADPPSFGWHRLITQARTHPDLAIFVSQHGLPDFLAETGNHQQHYLILYYLADRKAFACRNDPSRELLVEFAGPYPITDKEFRMLDTFRRDPTRKPAVR